MPSSRCRWLLLILLSALQGVDINLERAALSLGAAEHASFCASWSRSRFPGIMSAALFAFLASFDELIIALFLAGARAQTLPVRIWNSLHLEIEPVIAAVSAFLIAVTGVVLLVDGGSAPPARSLDAGGRSMTRRPSPFRAGRVRRARRAPARRAARARKSRSRCSTRSRP